MRRKRECRSRQWLSAFMFFLSFADRRYGMVMLLPMRNNYELGEYMYGERFLAVTIK